MRIFIHGVDSFLGRALVRELRRRAPDEGGFHKIFGTVNGSVDQAPVVVKRPIPSISSMGGDPDPKKHKKFVETVQSCSLVIIDLESCTEDDLLFAITCLKVDPKSDPPRNLDPPFESEIKFVLVSSLMVWADTPIPAGDVLRDADFPKRTPIAGSRYERWKKLEELVFRCFNTEESKVKAYIVAPGVLYGDGEEAFGQLFKGAWLGQQDHYVVSPGTNLVPTVHVRDLARVVRQIGFAGDPSTLRPPPASEEEPFCPYFLVVDQPPAPAPPPAPIEAPAPEAAPSDDPVGDEAADGDDAGAAAPPPEEDAGEPAEPAGEVAPPPDIAPPKPRPSTQADLVEGIVNEICERCDVPVLDQHPVVDEETRSMRDAMELNLNVEPTWMMLQETFADTCEPAGWWSRDGLIANMRKVADEFCTERKLRAMRALVAGPPASGKTELAKSIAEHYNIKHLTLNAHAKDAGDFLDQTLESLKSKVCRYRGYVLDVTGASDAQLEQLFFMDKPYQPPAEGEEEEAAPAVDEDNPDAEPAAPKPPPRVLNEELCPEFVIITQATDDLCRARWKSRAIKQGDTSGAMEEYYNRTDRYAQENLADDVMGIAGFFQIRARIGVLNLPIAGLDEEEMLESARIYMDGSKLGRPFNYLPTEREVAEQIIKTKEERAAAAAEAAAAEARRIAEDKTEEIEEARNQDRRLKIIAEYEAERKNLEALPLREYLMRYMVPSLTEGLIEVCKVLPEDPVDYLASYLEDHAASSTQVGQDNGRIASH